MWMTCFSLWQTTCSVPSCRMLQAHILFPLPGAGASFTGAKWQFGVVYLIFPRLAPGCGCHDPVKSSSAKRQRGRIYKIPNRKELPEVAHEPQSGLLQQGEAERCVTSKCPYKAVTLARWGPAVWSLSWHCSPSETIKTEKSFIERNTKNTQVLEKTSPVFQGTPVWD